MRLPRKFFEQKTLSVAKNLLGCFLIRQIGRKRIVARIVETEAYCGPKDLANHASKGKTKRTEVMFNQAGHAYVYLIYGMYYCFNVVTEKMGYPAAVLIRGIEIIDDTKFSIFLPACRRQSGFGMSATGRHGNFQFSKNFQFSNFKLLKQKTSNKLQTTKIIGPGKVCRELKIDKSFNGADLIKNNRLYFVRVVNNRVADSPLFPLCYRSRFGGQACCPLVKIKKLPRVGVDYAKAYKDKKWRFVLFENRKS